MSFAPPPPLSPIRVYSINTGPGSVTLAGGASAVGIGGISVPESLPADVDPSQPALLFNPIGAFLKFVKFTMPDSAIVRIVLDNKGTFTNSGIFNAGTSSLGPGFFSTLYIDSSYGNPVPNFSRGPSLLPLNISFAIIDFGAGGTYSWSSIVGAIYLTNP